MAIFTSKDLPNVRPVADFNFAATKTLDKRITFSRNSIGTYYDELGVVRYASNNVPRFDHDPSTGKCLGLLVEEPRSNILPFSEDEGNWTENSAGTITTNSGIAPDGTNTASKISTTSTDLDIGPITSGTTGGNSYLSGLSSGSTYTYSGFFKASTDAQVGNNFMIRMKRVSGDLVTASDTFALTSEWVRQSVTFTLPANVDRIWTYVGGVVGSEALVWGLQVEEGAFATSYIPTSGSTVTRAQDQTIIKKENFTKVFDTGFNSFSALVDYDNLSTSDGPVFDIFTLWGETTGYTDRVSISKDNASPYHIETRAFGNNIAIFNNGNFTGASKAAVQKFAFSWDVPSYSSSTGKAWKFSFSGADVSNVSAPSTQALPALTRMGIGINPTRLTEAAGHTHFKRVAIYNQVLSDEELKSISAI